MWYTILLLTICIVGVSSDCGQLQNAFEDWVFWTPLFEQSPEWSPAGHMPREFNDYVIIDLPSNRRYRFRGTDYEHLLISQNGYIHFDNDYADWPEGEPPKLEPPSPYEPNPYKYDVVALYYAETSIWCFWSDIYWRTSEDDRDKNIFSQVIEEARGEPWQPDHLTIVTFENVDRGNWWQCCPYTYTMYSTPLSTHPDGPIPKRTMMNSYQVAIATKEVPSCTCNDDIPGRTVVETMAILDYGHYGWGDDQNVLAGFIEKQHGASYEYRGSFYNDKHRMFPQWNNQQGHPRPGIYAFRLDPRGAKPAPDAAPAEWNNGWFIKDWNNTATDFQYFWV